MADVRVSSLVDGVVHVSPVVNADPRGMFVESYRREWVPGSRAMVQANRADRVAGSVVGLHYHLGQADYWYVPSGLVRVVLHDLRAGSPTGGSTECFDLGGAGDGSGDGSEVDAHGGVYIPPGVAHGFAALTDATITYLVDAYYDPADELGVAWDDPVIGADWGLGSRAPVLSGRDLSNPGVADIPEGLLPTWAPAGGASR
ncbi:MAG: dTDP-4-dehydrorhamnose 3,5-epimerase family protein [Acidimicrobiales bacterium]|nr:dTDP-4-dehydrorhamnose 3,5-epimerase family protein [Acidimicrobiales bacterium]